MLLVSWGLLYNERGLVMENLSSSETSSCGKISFYIGFAFSYVGQNLTSFSMQSLLVQKLA